MRAVPSYQVAHNTLHVIGARCVARDFHTTVPGPLERTCWRQLAAQRGDCKKSRTVPLNVVIIIIIIINKSLLSTPPIARLGSHVLQFRQILTVFFFFLLFFLLLLLGSPAISLEFDILGEIFAYVTVFNPAIEVVTFCLRGWCMLGVFLLPAFTCLGHGYQDLLSPCDGMHVCKD